jgi:hypothetical protein
MKQIYLIIIILTLLSINSLAQIERLPNESAEDFAKRNAPPKSELVHQVIETTAWGNKKSIIAFYQLENESATQVNGYLFLPKSANNYEKILIHNFEEEGGTPEIKAVFFANADKDLAQELVVICSWRQSHYGFSGTLYGTYIFDDLGKDLKFLEKISEKVSGGCDCNYRDGTKGTKKFNSATKVKAGLKRLGFR